MKEYKVIWVVDAEETKSGKREEGVRTVRARSRERARIAVRLWAKEYKGGYAECSAREV